MNVTRHALYLVVVCAAAAAGWARAARGEDENADGQVGGWPVEKLEMADGRVLEGLIESEDGSWINLIEIRRPKGKPMYLLVRPVERRRVAQITRLPPDARELLRRRIEEFRNRAAVEAARIGAVPLAHETIDGVRRQLYRGTWFTLDATTEPYATRWLIVHCEQAFTAYRQLLPPQVRPNGKLRLEVFGTTEPYRKRLAALGLKIENLAVYVPHENVVLAGSELSRGAVQLKLVEEEHRRLSEELGDMELRLANRLQQLGNQLRQQGVPREIIARSLRQERTAAEKKLQAKQKEIARCERNNEKAFNQLAGQTLRRLYHEAFHAYLENYVYPRRSRQVPLWLNEGLAVLFEGGQLESGMLRVDGVNRTALAALKADLAGDAPLPLARLLEAGNREFLANGGAAPNGAANRYYHYAWGLAYYLTIEKRFLSGDRLDSYVAPGDATPTARFERLVGMPLAEFERAWRDSIAKLR